MLTTFILPATEVHVLAAEFGKSLGGKRVLNLKLARRGQIVRETLMARNICDLLFELVHALGFATNDAQSILNSALANSN